MASESEQPDATGLWDISNNLLGVGSSPTEHAQEAAILNMNLLKEYMPRMMQARQMGVEDQLARFGPANEYLMDMYGADVGMDLSAPWGVSDYLADPTPLVRAQQATAQQLEPAETTTVEDIGSFSFDPVQYVLKPATNAGE